MVYTLLFFSSSKCSLFHNSNAFGSCIIHVLYIYSTNIGTEYFKHDIHSPIFPPQNAVRFIILTYLVPVLFTFYIQGVLKLKYNNSGAKGLITKNSSTLNVANDYYRRQTDKRIFTLFIRQLSVCPCCTPLRPPPTLVVV